MPSTQQKRYRQSSAATAYTAAQAPRICSAEQWAAYLAVTAFDKSHYQIKRIFFDTTGVLGFDESVKYRGANGAIRTLAATPLNKRSQKTCKKAIAMLGRIGATFHQVHSRSEFHEELAKGHYLGGRLVIRVTHVNLASQSAVGAGASVKILKVLDQPLFSVYTSSLMINSKLPRHLLLPTVIHELAHIVGVGHMGLNFNTQRPLCNENPPNGLTDHQQSKMTVLMKKNKCVVPFNEKAGQTSIMFCAFHPGYKGALKNIPPGDAIHIKQQFDLMTGLRKNKKKKKTQKNKKRKKQRVSFKTHDLVEYCPYSNISRCLLLRGDEPFITNSGYHGLRLFDSINRSSGLLVARESADNPLSFSESLSAFSIMMIMIFLMRLSIKLKVCGLKSDKSLDSHKSRQSSHSMQKNGL